MTSHLDLHGLPRYMKSQKSCFPWNMADKQTRIFYPLEEYDTQRKNLNGTYAIQSTRYLEFQRTLLHSSRYPYLDISKLQN